MKLTELATGDHKYHTSAQRTNKKRKRNGRRTFKWQPPQQAQQSMISDLWLYANADAT